MCIAILNTAKGKGLKKQTLKNCWENNGDGAGMIFIKDGKVETYKEMTDFNRYYNEYAKARKHGSNIVLHFRISTHGKVNEANCHPFKVNDELAFVHNGIIGDVPYSKEFSDTVMFNEHILQNLPQGFLESMGIIELLHTFIGSYNKLVFLDVNDKPTIINETAGHWFEGNWFSNNSYKQVNDWVDYGGTKKYKSSLGYTSSCGTSSGYQAKNSGFQSAKYSAPTYKPTEPKGWCDCFQTLLSDDEKDYYSCGQKDCCKSCVTEDDVHAHTDETVDVYGNIYDMDGCCDFCGQSAKLTVSEIDPVYGAEKICKQCVEWFTEATDSDGLAI